MPQQNDGSSPIDPSQTSADVVIVGGGPIGLAQAIGFKKLNPDLKVVVLEKYDEFQRKHTLVMQAKQLKALMLATNSMNDPTLQALLKQLRKNPHIRTNVIQETFKKIAIDNGVTIKIEEVKPDTIEDQLRTYKPKLIVGADGTHSVVNAQLFPEGNQIKHEIDYAMQVRLEIDGDVDKNFDQIIAFYQRLTLHGLIATEQVGRPDPKTGKTPVTMQIIIPKEDYELLNNLSNKPNAKNPIKPFTGMEQRELPPHLQKFIDSYLVERLQISGSKIAPESIRISVNELPATRVRQTYTHYTNADNSLDAYVSLGGDAESSLSYFKGFNAGLERSAKYFKTMKPAIEQGLTDKELLKTQLSTYEKWFAPYADKKINEVKQYSTFKVRSGIKVVKAVKGTKSFSAHKPEVDKKPLIDAYYRLLTHAGDDDSIEFKPYPHRAYNPEIQLGQFSYVSLRYTFKKIGKLFVDFFKPYKATYQVIDDLRQPITSITNISSGVVKMMAGVFTLNPRRFIDGMATFSRGLLEMATSVLLPLKLVMRGIITAFNKPKKIEESSGLLKLVHMGENLLDSQDDDELFSFHKMQLLLGICNDVHRKFDKSSQRGQETNINSETEQMFLKALTSDANTPLTKQKVRNYIRLFTDKTACEPNVRHEYKPPQADEEQLAAPAA